MALDIDNTRDYRAKNGSLKIEKLKSEHTGLRGWPMGSLLIPRFRSRNLSHIH